jgi:thioredoxin-like negative regulator of GroEL
MRGLLETVYRYGNWIVAVLVAFVIYQAFSGQTTATKPPKYTEEQFTAAIENDAVPVIVKFGATWCPPCRSTDKALEQFEKTTPGKAKVLIVDVDTSPELAQRFSVGSIPHSFLFFRGKMIDEHVGGMDADDINTWLDKKLISFPAGK